jgi:hypothetical protein
LQADAVLTTPMRLRLALLLLVGHTARADPIGQEVDHRRETAGSAAQCVPAACDSEGRCLPLRFVWGV